MEFIVKPIAHIHTPYKEKFAIPRQPGIVDSALGYVQFTPEFSDPNYIRGIEQFSHLWLIFQFHQNAEKECAPLVRPPRLGGNKKIGVLASRSTFRPNGLGMSVVKLEGIEQFSGHQQFSGHPQQLSGHPQQHEQQLSGHPPQHAAQHTGHPCLIVSGMDLLDKTPIIDIKPYVPYADSVTNAQAGYAQEEPATMPVKFSEKAQAQIAEHASTYPLLSKLVHQVLSQDPRPAYKQTQSDERLFGVQLYDFNIRWQVIQGTNVVHSCEIIKKPDTKR